jgi:hypothetical protein
VVCLRTMDERYIAKVAYAKEIFSCHAHFELTVTDELSTDYIVYAFYIPCFRKKSLTAFHHLTFFRTLLKVFWVKGFLHYSWSLRNYCNQKKILPSTTRGHFHQLQSLKHDFFHQLEVTSTDQL